MVEPESTRGGARPGAGRPKVAEHRITLGLTRDLLVRLDAYCAAWEVEDSRGRLRPLTRSEGLRQLIERHARP